MLCLAANGRKLWLQTRRTRATEFDYCELVSNRCEFQSAHRKVVVVYSNSGHFWNFIWRSHDFPLIKNQPKRYQRNYSSPEEVCSQYLHLHIGNSWKWLNFDVNIITAFRFSWKYTHTFVTTCLRFFSRAVLGYHSEFNDSFFFSRIGQKSERVYVSLCHKYSTVKSGDVLYPHHTFTKAALFSSLLVPDSHFRFLWITVSMPFL